MTFAHAKISRMRAVRLQDWGWNQEWEDVSPATSDASEIGRVVREDRRRLRVMTERGARLPRIAARASRAAMPRLPWAIG